MESLTAIGFLLSLVSALAVILAVANIKLKVFEDPRIDQVNDMLPGNNCGACGLPGCRAFAEKTVSGDIKPSDCPVGNAAAAALSACAAACATHRRRRSPHVRAAALPGAA